MRHEHRRRAEEAQRILKDLLAWERYMGGWEAPCWEEARQFVKEGEDDEEEAPTTECCGQPHNPDHGQYCPRCS